MKEKYDTRPGRALGNNGFRANSELDVLKDIARRLKELVNTQSSGGGGGGVGASYNNEEEILLKTPTSYVISAGSVHSYAVMVEDGAAISTIQVGSGSVNEIKKGYIKSVEFSTANTQSVSINCVGDNVIRIVKIKA